MSTNDRSQGFFDFDASADESGYERWVAEKETARKNLERQFGFRFGKRVQLQLKEHFKPLTGIIRLQSSTQGPGEAEPRLQIGSVSFSPGEIESCSLLPEQAEESENEYDYLEEALPGFCRARALIKANDDKLQPLAFVGSKFDFYRFVNRFRLAVSFEGMKLNGFTEETLLGYDALTRSFFAWSAFERYAELASDRAPYRSLFAHHPRKHIKELAAHCRALDPGELLINFLCAQSVDTRHETYLKRYRDGQDFAVLNLAACMRHVFAHGNLTAHPNGLAAKNLSAISRSLGNFLIHFIRSDFDRRLQVAEASQATRQS
ncbi:MAG: hypothetical protein Q7Q71_16525 [Verrucomicrobiota bacterium JB023]|nr:hypothetical protein [Verrucomicrobiota bacterium JB023]